MKKNRRLKRRGSYTHYTHNTTTRTHNQGIYGHYTVSLQLAFCSVCTTITTTNTTTTTTTKLSILLLVLQVLLFSSCKKDENSLEPAQLVSKYQEPIRKRKMRFSPGSFIVVLSLLVVGSSSSSTTTTTVEAFVPTQSTTRSLPSLPSLAFAPRTSSSSSSSSSYPHVGFDVDGQQQWSHSQQKQQQPFTVLFAKKKANAKLAALEALEALEEQTDLLDAPLSKKEQKQLEKQKKKEEQEKMRLEEQKAAEISDADTASSAVPPVNGEAVVNGVNGDTSNGDDSSSHNNNKPMSKKEKMLAKALEMEAMDAAAAASQGGNDGDDNTPKLSKKELKALKKKEEKMAAKAAAKAEKKAQRAEELAAAENEDTNDAPPPVVNGDSEKSSQPEPSTESGPAPKKQVTLEDKIRKERPPPRIRVMEGAQPGYVSLRMENVGITFRNQEVLKDVTWGVQSGDRIGLVGKNGAGKTTQLRIMAGELEPTTGDVVKSSGDLRTAMLRQEFVDELVKERTLKEEFMSVFVEENQILQDLKDTEAKLEEMSGEDPDAMQEILDRMQELQEKAEDKDVYVLESRVKKTMDLMGFNDDEQDDLVASFSGGWKMRIGLGKVLLKEPNVLLLGKLFQFLLS